MSEQTLLTIRGVADLHALNPYSRDRVRFRAIKLELPKLSDADRATLEDRLRRYYFACGCAEAAVVGLIALATVPIWITVRPDGWNAATWYDGVYAAGAFLLGTGLGKGLGLRRARYRLRREVRSLRRLLSEGTAPKILDGAIRRCGVG